MGRGVHARVSKRRRVVRWLARVGVLLTFIVAMTVVSRDEVPLPDPPKVDAPTLSEVNRAIQLAEQNLSGLYRQLDSTQAVQSEYYGLPLRMHLVDRDAWALLGDEACLFPCITGVSITPLDSTPSTEAYKMNFGSFFVADVSMDWSKYTITVKPRKVAERAQLYLDTLLIGEFLAGDTKPVVVKLKPSERELFRSMRYTVRHATQEAYMYWLLKGDKKRTQSLRGFLQSNGFTPGYDVRAAIAGRSQSLPDNLPIDERAYEDCDVTPRRVNLEAYAYRSKVCLVQDLYFTLGSRDPFFQATLGLHLLQKHGKLDHRYPGGTVSRWWQGASTPRETSDLLRRLWRSEVGMPKCTPTSCDKDASGIRTFMFGTFQALAGYGYDDATARQYADAAAALTIANQIQSDGKFHFGGDVFYRPAFAGAFLASWNRKGEFVDPSEKSSAASVLGAAVLGKVSMPPEYRGIIPSNSETTFDGLFFLLGYRCLKYQVGCSMTGLRAP